MNGNAKRQYCRPPSLTCKESLFVYRNAVILCADAAIWAGFYLTARTARNYSKRKASR